MARTDDDTWDLTSSVGSTATVVAAARAMVSRLPDPLVRDPFAEPLVRAVGIEPLTRLAGGELTASDFGDDGGIGMARMAEAIAVRTRFFDDFFGYATDAGVRQAVILAAGLDARAYRLNWPDGTIVYEVDQPDVVEFKTRTLAEFGARPTAERRTVPIDLRGDWSAALRAAGFDAARPAAFSAEGLLGYLPAAAQDQLLDTVTALSAPGSRLATDTVSKLAPEARTQMRQHMSDAADGWRRHGFDFDLAGMVYFGERNDAAEYLTSHGWRVQSRGVSELLSGYGREPLGEDTGFAHMAYLTGVLG